MNKERVKAILNYKEYDRIPMVSFGYRIEIPENGLMRAM